MILLFFVVIGVLALLSIIYGYLAGNAFAFTLGAVGLLMFAALLLSGLEVQNGVEKIATDEWQTTYLTHTVDNDPTVQTLFYFSLSLGLFSLGYLLMDLFGVIGNGE